MSWQVQVLQLVWMQARVYHPEPEPEPEPEPSVTLRGQGARLYSAQLQMGKFITLSCKGNGALASAFYGAGRQAQQIAKCGAEAAPMT